MIEDCATLFSTLAKSTFKLGFQLGDSWKKSWMEKVQRKILWLRKLIRLEGFQESFGSSINRSNISAKQTQKVFCDLWWKLVWIIAQKVYKIKVLEDLYFLVAGKVRNVVSWDDCLTWIAFILLHHFLFRFSWTISKAVTAMSWSDCLISPALSCFRWSLLDSFAISNPIRTVMSWDDCLILPDLPFSCRFLSGSSLECRRSLTLSLQKDLNSYP